MLRGIGLRASALCWALRKRARRLMFWRKEAKPLPPLEVPKPEKLAVSPIAAGDKRAAPEPDGPALSQWETAGAHLYRQEGEDVSVVFTNKRKGVTRVIVDNRGVICGFPGVDRSTWSRAGAFTEAQVRYASSFERQPDGRIMMIWQVQPDGRYWEDEDGYGGSSDPEIKLYAWLDENGRFAGPFKLYSVGVRRYYDRDLEAGKRLEEEGRMAEAYARYALAANRNVAEAQYRAGMCLLEGAGVEKAPETAFPLLYRAACAGIPEAMKQVGICLEQGVGVEANPDHAAIWKTRAAAHRQ